MARIRTIKPEMFTDEKLTECSLSARYLFSGLFCFADDMGNLERSAKRIKMQIFPADNIDAEPLLQELLAHGVITEYSVSGKLYLHIQGFAKHQRINRPSTPIHPIYEESLRTHQGLTEDSLPEKEKEKEKDKKDKPNGLSKKGTRLDADFELPDEWKVWARDQTIWPDIVILREFEKFRDYWIAKSGSGATKLDWAATWRNWVRTAARGPQNQQNPRSPIKTQQDINNEQLALYCHPLEHRNDSQVLDNDG